MTGGSSDARSSFTRRRLLAAGLGATAVATSGCLQRVRSLVGRPTVDQVSLTIKTMPADADRPATRIARSLANNLEAVGVDTNIALMPEDEIRRDVLTKGDYDIYVDQCPTHPDPDYLRPLLASEYKGEPGWQNPFELTNLDVDELLEEQRTKAGSDRGVVIDALQRKISELQPFTIVAVPNEISAVRADRFVGWNSFGLSSPLNYVAVERAGEAGPSGRLRVTSTDSRITENLNPIAVEFRDRGTFTGLLYDSLARWIDGEVRAWAARDWEWESEENTTLTVELRPDLTWHDGTDLTAYDVAFTYRFLRDTTLDPERQTVPAPRFRGRVSLVEAVEVLDDETLQLSFGGNTPEVARRALTVPIFPQHEWEAKSAEADLAGVQVNDRVTEALVWANPEPVGSGPLQFENLVQEEQLLLSRFDDHFLHDETPLDLIDYVGTGVPYEELSVRVVPSDASAVELLAAGEAEATASSTDPAVVPRIGRNDSLTLLVDRSPSFYHVGFNTRREPLGNPHFRRTVARLVDKQHVADDIFDGYAEPAATPLEGTDWVAPDLEWEGDDPEFPFAGEDGDLDEIQARELFRDVGFRYDERDRLLHQR